MRHVRPAATEKVTFIALSNQWLALELGVVLFS
jgi:hypothetical protein